MNVFSVVLTATFALGLASGCTYSKSTFTTITPENVTEGSEITSGGDADRTIDVIVPESGEVVERPSEPSAEATEEPRLIEAVDAPVRVGDAGPRDGDLLNINPSMRPAAEAPASRSPVRDIPTEIHPGAVQQPAGETDEPLSLATTISETYTPPAEDTSLRLADVPYMETYTPPSQEAPIVPVLYSTETYRY